MLEQKNLIVAIVLSLVILLGFQYFYEMPRMRAQQEALQAQQALQAPQTPAAPRPGAPGVPGVPGSVVDAGAQAQLDRAAILAGPDRVRIQSPRITGSIALIGARLDDVTLSTYRQTTHPDSP